jgi:GMP synthase-like glutamine amidotransferase
MRPHKIKVAIIDNSINPSVYTPVEHWSKYLKVEWESFRAPRKFFPKFREGFTHLILTGSEASILDRKRWVQEEVELVQEAVALGLRLLGSCYGHQLLVLALLGPSHVGLCTVPEIGWIPIEVKEDNGLLGKKGLAYVFSSHFDEVLDLDESFRVLASTDNCRVQAFELKGRPVWGIQPHPEIDIGAAQKFLKSLIGLRLATGPLFEKALASVPRDSGLVGHILAEFLGS